MEAADAFGETAAASRADAPRACLAQRRRQLERGLRLVAPEVDGGDRERGTRPAGAASREALAGRVEPRSSGRGIVGPKGELAGVERRGPGPDAVRLLAQEP